MMKKTTFLSFSLLLFLFLGCEEICDCPKEPEKTTCKFAYSNGTDNPLYLPTLRGVQLIEPILSDTVGGGTFTAEPQGLDMDSRTGIININTSDPGIQYYITYTSADGNNTCETSITIGGIDYPSDTFRLSNPNRINVSPFVDGIRDQPVESGIFDQPELLGKTNVLPARSEGLAIDPETGVINLSQTVENLRGLGENVANGYSKTFEIVYALGDREDFPSSIDVTVLFYGTADDVPPELYRILEEKQRFPRNGREEGKIPPYLIILEK